MKLAAAMKWAKTPQGQKTIRKTADFAKDHEREIKAVGRVAIGTAKNMADNFKEAAKRFKEELRDDEEEEGKRDDGQNKPS
ncbi:hypothetical protein MNBD_NITROSPINAE02-326 [hydrothermal vent metagenome]|uniref:Uncharacterized protein n=1 Tax=hydrothermal vent metagenome TaxID=652676 RepID=A0A3B1BJG8_9ZZZZ